MTLGREDVSVTRTNGGADVFRLAGFFRDNDLIGHGAFVSKNQFETGRHGTYSERNRLASFVGRLRRDLLASTDAAGLEIEHKLPRLGSGVRIPSPAPNYLKETIPWRRSVVTSLFAFSLGKRGGSSRRENRS